VALDDEGAIGQRNPARPGDADGAGLLELHSGML
jgi:hypothetical protein